MSSASEERKRKAETLAGEPAVQAPDPQTLHELRVHQIELELQNEELRRTQLELEAAQRRFTDQLHQSQRLEALGALVAGVTHDLNNVLAAIMGAASLREGNATDAEDQAAYRIIGKACRRGRDVVRSLAHFAKPSCPDQAPLELQALLTEVRVLLENTTRNHLQVREVFCGEPMWIRGDAGSLNHVFLNLCLNALDAMPQGGTLTLRTAIPAPDWIEVAVEDDGEGMTPEVLAHAFAPFFTTKEVGKGTGLGLSMAHGVIKAHGGTLAMESQVGRGTTVTLRLPRIPAPVPQAPLPETAPSLGPLRVLLVDDDATFRELEEWMLHQTGNLEVTSLPGGKEALESLGSGPLPDVIVLDQNMPRMDGIETLKQIRLRYPRLPILIASGQPAIEAWPCFRQPHVATISKPFEVKELLAKLAQVAPCLSIPPGLPPLS